MDVWALLIMSVVVPFCLDNQKWLQRLPNVPGWGTGKPLWVRTSAWHFGNPKPFVSNTRDKISFRQTHSATLQEWWWVKEVNRGLSWPVPARTKGAEGTLDGPLPKASLAFQVTGHRAEDGNLAGFPFHQMHEQERRKRKARASPFR